VPVLLQNAKAVVCNHENEKRLGIPILLDNGIQQSYISEEVYKKLGLKSLGKHCLHLNTFGSGKIARNYCEVVRFDVKTCSGEIVNISGLRYHEDFRLPHALNNHCTCSFRKNDNRVIIERYLWHYLTVIII